MTLNLIEWEICIIICICITFRGGSSNNIKYIFVHTYLIIHLRVWFFRFFRKKSLHSCRGKLAKFPHFNAGGFNHADVTIYNLIFWHGLSRTLILYILSSHLKPRTNFQPSGGLTRRSFTDFNGDEPRKWTN